MTVKLPDLTAGERPTPGFQGGGVASYRTDFGGQEAAGVATMRLGNQFEHAGDEIYKAAEVEKGKVDNLLVQDAVTRLNEQKIDLTYGEKNGYTNLRGKSAVDTDIYKDWGKRFQDVSADIENGLQTEEQKQKYRQHAAVAAMGYGEGILRYKVGQVDVYTKEVAAGKQAIATREATAGWDNPYTIAGALLDSSEAVRMQAERFDWPKEFADAEKLKANGAIHNAVVQQALASGAFEYAQKYYEQNKADIDPNTAKAMEIAVRDGTQKQLAANYGAQFIEYRDNPEALRALADRVLVDPKLDDTRKNTLRNGMLSRADTVEKQITTRMGVIDKEFEREKNKLQSITLSGFEPTQDQIQPLINMSRGTKYQAEVDELVRLVDATRVFRQSGPVQQEAIITDLSAKIRSGAGFRTAQSTFDALVNAVRNAETGGEANPAGAVSPQGAVGSMQITKPTFDAYAKPGESFSNEKDRVTVALRKLEDDFRFYQGDVAKTAAAYLGGRGAVDEAGKIRETYVKDGKVVPYADAFGTTPKAYAAKVMAMVGGSDVLRYDMNMLKAFETIHAQQKTALQESSITYAVRQGLVAPDSPAAKPIDLTNPAKVDPAALAARVALAAEMTAKTGAPFKPLTVAEADLAAKRLKTMPVTEQREWFNDLLKAASNNAGNIVSGMRDDQGGIRAYKAIMGQIAPDSPVLAHAGIAAARGLVDPKQGNVADLILQGDRIQNPDRKTDGKPDGSALRKMPDEAKMRLDFDNIVRDAFAGDVGQASARNGYYQTAKAIYVALSSKSADADTTKLDSERWKESIRMAAGEITNYNSKYTPVPYGLTPGDFKDGVAARVNSLMLSGRMPEGMTVAKLRDMKLDAVGDGRYEMMVGDRVLVDKFNKKVVIDFNSPVPYGTPWTTGAVAPTSAELAEASRPYLGTPRTRQSGAGGGK